MIYPTSVDYISGPSLTDFPLDRSGYLRSTSSTVTKASADIVVVC